MRIRTTAIALVASGALLACTMAGCGGSDSSSGSGGTGATDGGAGTDGGGAAGTDGGATCGNGVVEGTEECDDGNSVQDDGCDNTCSFVCVAGDPKRDHCDDGNACNGTETCGTDHACTSGTPLNDGDSCGTDMVCVNGNCISASCGDALVQNGEECDDGNSTPGDGCENDCKFSCLSTDTARDCSALGGDECAGAQTCNDTTHMCEGTPLADNTPCNNNTGYCKSGVCATGVCGNSQVEPGEDCDDGNTVETDGCTSQCKFSCTVAGDCGDSNVCTQDTCDTTTHMCANPADTGQNGNNCTVGSVSGKCDNGVCKSANCGNSTVDSGEQCDKGSANGTAGSGCTASCQYECNANADCSDNNVCTGTETCKTVTGGKACSPGTNAAKGTVCQQSNPRRVCDGSGTCAASTCGDGYVDKGATPAEQCEPPNTATCDASCQTIQAAVCGDGKIDPGEDCDDGNTKNLDGCDSSCKYELFMRMDTVSIVLGTAPTFCSVTTNRLGQAITSNALGTLNTSLTDGINAGTTNILVQALDLDDPKGVADPSLRLGVTTGILDPAHTGTWPATGNPMDWWFLLDKTTVDANGIPTGILSPAAIAARALTAGPSDVNLTLLLAGSPAVLQMLQAKVAAHVETTTSKPAPPPSQLASGFVAALKRMNTTTSRQRGPVRQHHRRSRSAKDPDSAAGVRRSGADGMPAETCAGLAQYTYCGDGNPLVRTATRCSMRWWASSPRSSACLGTGTSSADAAGRVRKRHDERSASAVHISKVQQTTAGNTNAYSSWLQFHAKRVHATGSQ